MTADVEAPSSKAAAREAAADQAVLARRTLWLTAERVVFSIGVIIAAMFPWFQVQDRVYGLWSFLVGFEANPCGAWAGAWTLVTIALVAAGLATPGGMVRPRRRWATAVSLVLLAIGHLVVLITYANASFFSVSPTYWALILLAAASACVWWPRADIDEVV